MDDPIGIRVQVAVCKSDLRPALRHLLMAMATMANRQTGVGLASQATLGAATGYSERAVRAMLAELEAMPDAPVRVTRRARFRPDGRGRTSDEYRLEVPGVTGSHVPVSRAPTGSHVPVESGDQPEAGDRLTGSWRPTNRQPRAGDPRRDPRRDPRSTARGPARRSLVLVSGSEREQLRDAYAAAYLGATGAAPALSRRQWAKAWRGFDELLAATGSLERAKACVARTFADDWRRSRRCQPWEIAADANALLAACVPRYASDDERQRVRNRLLTEAENGRHGPVARTWARDGRPLGRLADLLEVGITPEAKHYEQARETGPRGAARPAGLVELRGHTA